MKILLAFIVSFSAFAKINGEFTSEFKRKDMDCMIQAKISSKKTLKLLLRTGMNIVKIVREIQRNPH